MKKVMIFTNHSFMLWQFRRELIQEMLKDYEVVIATPFNEHVEDFITMGCRMIETSFERRNINPIVDIKLYKKYKYLLKTESPDIVITYSIKPNIYAGYACSVLEIPYCVNVQGLGTAFQKRVISQIVTIMYRIALKKSKVVFFENTGNADTFITRNIISVQKSCVLNGAGVNLDHYRLQEYPNNDCVHFLYLGRIMKEKGIDELFAAAEMLKHDGEKFVLDLVGFFEDEYQTTVEQLQRRGIVEYHGFQSDPRPFYAKADCVVLPSYHEGMSNVLLEASAIGRPIITSDINGCKEAVIHEQSGFLCRTHSSVDLYNCMKKILNLKRIERKNMGLEGRKFMEEYFDKQSVIKKVLNYIY